MKKRTEPFQAGRGKAEGTVRKGLAMSSLAPIRRIAISRAASLHPLIDLDQLELPQPANSVGRKTLVVDPPVHGISSNAEMSRNFVHGVPAFVGHVRLPVQIGQRRP